MTIPADSNVDNFSVPSSAGWRVIPGHPGTGPHRRLLYVESYGEGSHLRIARLIQSRSRHHVDIIVLDRGHWRALALTGHRGVLDALANVAERDYDAILFSGPADLRLIRPNLPRALSGLPVITYFHESQWIYPAESLDRIPHLVSHLESVETSDVIWFNSRFHQRAFYETAINSRSRLLRSMAREILPGIWRKTDVLYPPVSVGTPEDRGSTGIRVSWSARWEREKRPDLLLAVARECIHRGIDISLTILGCETERWSSDPEMTGDVRAIIDPCSGYQERSTYESLLASSDVWLSTAEHEFFGVSAIEAAMLGAIPVVPAALAYPETLPSAFTYQPGDVDGAVDAIAAIAEMGRRIEGPWTIDARRFRSDRSIWRFDEAIEEVVKNGER